MDIQQIQDLIHHKNFPDSAANPELIETHISWVILTDHYVFKIKKPFQYSFLDFSTLEKRQYYCQRELELNSRLAEAMYITVLPVVRSGAETIVKENPESGETIMDYALQMHRMDPSLEMDKLLAADQVSAEDVRKIAAKVARFHKQTEVLYPEFDEKVFVKKFDDINSIRQVAMDLLGEEYGNLIDDATTKSSAFIKANTRLLKKRSQSGFIRDCHGDLHSKNIFLYDDPVIFDCAEFNDEFRQIDILNEVAFFCMDLEANGANELSRIAYKAYVEAMPELDPDDTQLYNLFTYFKAYRANVRGKVIALKLKDESPDSIASEKKNEIANYFELMVSYLQDISKVE